MGFVGIILPIQQILHSQCFLKSFWYLRSLLFRIKSQPVLLIRKCCLIKKKQDEITFPWVYECIFVFIPYFIGAIWTYGDGCPRMKLWGTTTLMGHSCKDFHSLMLRDAEGWPEILLSFWRRSACQILS